MKTPDSDLSGTTEISDEGIKKHFKNLEPWEAIFELAWNGFDAHAENVIVEVEENAADGTESVLVTDDGDGIDIANIKENFGKFNDSAKKEDAAQHGLNGRGRLAFHLLCNAAAWHTRSKAGAATIEVSGNRIKEYNGVHLKQTALPAPLKKLKGTGTCVQLLNFHTNLPEQGKLRELFSTEFGWFLAFCPNRQILLNQIPISVPIHEITKSQTQIDGEVFEIAVARWIARPNSEKSFLYLADSEGVTRHKQHSTFNQKTNFFTSIFVKSSWADNFQAGGKNLFSEDNATIDSDTWRQLVREVNQLTQKVYDDFLRRYVNAEMKKYKEDGIFPSYAGVDPAYATWREENLTNLVRVVYMADPSVISSLNRKQKKIIFRLLDRIAISNENDSLFEIFDGVLDLSDSSVSNFAEILKNTQLEYIISTIEILHQRQTAVSMLRELMDNHYKEVLETPDLQQIIEKNTWLFGSKFETIGAEEDTFTRIALNLRNTVPSINAVDKGDVDDDSETLVGAQKQTDLFLARKFQTFDSFGKKIYKCVVVEIKRPGISLNVKHLRQLDDYAAIIKKHPQFSSELMHFDLILLGRRISSADTEIVSRMKSQVVKGEMGLVSDDERMKRYVLNWYTLLDGFELSNGYLLEQLKLRRDNFKPFSKSELVQELQGVATCSSTEPVGHNNGKA